MKSKKLRHGLAAMAQFFRICLAANRTISPISWNRALSWAAWALVFFLWVEVFFLLWAVLLFEDAVFLPGREHQLPAAAISGDDRHGAGGGALQRGKPDTAFLLWAVLLFEDAVFLPLEAAIYINLACLYSREQ